MRRVSIEAARAGEAGAGFAVVQQDASRAVGAIREIGSVIGQISDIQSTIAGAVEEQAASTSEIARGGLALPAVRPATREKYRTTARR